MQYFPSPSIYKYTRYFQSFRIVRDTIDESMQKGTLNESNAFRFIASGKKPHMKISRHIRKAIYAPGFWREFAINRSQTKGWSRLFAGFVCACPLAKTYTHVGVSQSSYLWFVSSWDEDFNLLESRLEIWWYLNVLSLYCTFLNM